MKLAVMQPYFLPYLGYFDLLNMVDRWIVFDTPQYMKYGWVNRNRVLRMHSGWQYIMAPVKKHHHKISINQVEIASSEWTELILRQLEHYKKDAPFYAEVIAFLNECFSELSNNLAEVNTFLFRKVAARLGIERRIEVLSEMNLNLQGPISSPGDWGGLSHKRSVPMNISIDQAEKVFLSNRNIGQGALSFSFNHMCR